MQKYLMTETEEKLRTMGVTMDQRRRLMMASKLGLGPLSQLGAGPPGLEDKESRSRSPPPGRGGSQVAPPSALVALAPGGHLVPAQSAHNAKRRLADQAARAHAISRGGMAVKAMASAVVKAREDEEDLDSFLAGGRHTAVQVRQEKQKKLVFEQANLEKAQKSADEARRRAEEREALERLQAEEKRRQDEVRRRKEDEKRKEEEKQEEKRRRKEEKRKKREDEDEAAASAEADRKEKHSSGHFKAVMKENESKRQHWGESVKGRVSSDYKGLTDAELERRFGATQSSSQEKLMTEQEVLAMLRDRKSVV